MSVFNENYSDSIGYSSGYEKTVDGTTVWYFDLTLNLGILTQHRCDRWMDRQSDVHLATA